MSQHIIRDKECPQAIIKVEIPGNEVMVHNNYEHEKKAFLYHSLFYIMVICLYT